MTEEQVEYKYGGKHDKTCVCPVRKASRGNFECAGPGSTAPAHHAQGNYKPRPSAPSASVPRFERGLGFVPWVPPKEPLVDDG